MTQSPARTPASMLRVPKTVNDYLYWDRGAFGLPWNLTLVTSVPLEAQDVNPFCLNWKKILEKILTYSGPV